MRTTTQLVRVLLVVLISVCLATPFHSVASSQREVVWQQVNGMGKAIIQALAVNAAGHIFAGTYSGVYRSTDNGDTWTAVKAGLPPPGAYPLAVSPSRHIFAFSYGLRHLYRSTDNGDTWVDISSSRVIEAGILALAGDASGYLFAGTQRGIFRSTDDGETWMEISDIRQVLVLVVSPSGAIFAGTDGHGFFRSTDNGDTWTVISDPDWPAAFHFVSVLVVNASGHLFARAVNHMFRSTDNGDTWTKIDTGLPWVVTSLAVNAPGHIFAGTYGGGVLRSTDNGDTWTEINEGLTNKNIQPLVVNTAGYLFAGTDGGLFRTVEPTVSTTKSTRLNGYN